MTDVSHLTRMLGDQSTAPLDEKLRRFLAHVAKPDAVYFYGDGFPRQHLYQQAAVLLRLIEAGAITCGESASQPLDYLEWKRRYAVRLMNSTARKERKERNERIPQDSEPVQTRHDQQA